MKYLVALVVLALGTALPARADDYRKFEAAHPLAAGQALHVDFLSGDLEIEAGAGDTVEIVMEIECEWRRSDCKELLDDVEIAWRSSPRRLHLEVEGLASWRRARVDVDATIRMPATAVLSVDMTAGRLRIDGPTRDIRVDMGAGEVGVWVPESAVEGVALDVGVGDARLRGASRFMSGERAMLIGSEVDWNEGPGTARLDVELGVGEVTVWLD